MKRKLLQSVIHLWETASW